jgi:WD40 repeat protein
MREDACKVDEFVFIINKYLMQNKSSQNSTQEVGFSLDTKEQREFASNMYELFKDIDVNGDGDLEWQEFTSFTLEKANQLNQKKKLASLAPYYDSKEQLDPDCFYRHRNDLSKMVNIPNIGQFAAIEDHRNSIFLFNSRFGKLVRTIPLDSNPTAITTYQDKNNEIIVSACADMTLTTFSLDDPNPNKRYRQLQTWATPGVQLALAYQKSSKLLYSGGTNTNIYSWDIKKRNLISTLSGHTDIVMSLVSLDKLDNLASASLDKSVCLWDSYTNEKLLCLKGHKKGVFDLAYSPDYHLIFSCGFEQDAFVWSPFVSSCVFKLKVCKKN